MNKRKLPESPNNQPNQAASEQPDLVARAVLTRTRRMRRALSPWVQRWLETDPEVKSQWRGPLVRRQAAFSIANTRLLLARIENRREQSTVWQPDVGSLEPGLVDRFASSVTDRFEPFGAKHQPQPPTDQEALELPLANMTTGLVAGESERTPVIPSLPPFMRPAPARLPPAQQPDRQLPPKARLFSRVEEITSETLPATIGQPPDQPELDLPASTAVEAETSDEPTPLQGTSKQSDESSVQRRPAPEQLVAPLEGKILAGATSRQYLPLTEPLPMFRLRPQLSITKTVQPPVTPVRARAWLSTRGWRFKTKAQDTSAAPGRIARSVEALEQSTSPGQPLSPKPRLMMERVMGQDLSDVRIHTAQLAPLNVQAATRGRDIYVEPGQDRFEAPESLALLGHELTHVSRGSFVQTKPVAQTAILPQARVQAKVEDEEAVAESNEQTIMGLFQTSPAGPGTASSTSIFRQPTVPDLGMEETEPTGGFEDTEGRAGPPSPEELVASPELFQRHKMNVQLAALKGIREGDIPEELARGQVSIAPEELDTFATDKVPSEGEVTAIISLAEEPGEEEAIIEETKPALDLDHLARQVYPFIKQLLAVERERRAAI